MQKLVVVDARMVAPKGHGIGVYVRALANSFRINQKSSPYKLLFLINEQSRDESCWDGFETIICKSNFLAGSELLEIPKILKKCSADLYHSPSFASLLSCPCPYIQTIHDLNHLYYGSFFKKFYYRVLLKKFAKRASKILTVSEFARQEIESWLNRKIEPKLAYNVIVPSKSSSYLEDADLYLEKYGLKKSQYFFSLATLKSHKNLNLLLAVFQIFREQNKDWSLVLTNDPGYLIDGVVVLDNPTGKEFDTVFQNSGGVLVPSLYEGFGRVPLEAAVHGLPVVASNIPPHIDSLTSFQDTIKLIDPLDQYAWLDALVQLSKREINSISSEQQKQILDKYSPEELFSVMDGAYQEALNATES